MLQRKDYNEPTRSHIILVLYSHALKLVMASTITTLVLITYFKKARGKIFKMIGVIVILQPSISEEGWVFFHHKETIST